MGDWAPSLEWEGVQRVLQTLRSRSHTEEALARGKVILDWLVLID